jgi:hypothetical protein
MGSNDHLPEVCPACGATYAATQLAADLESLLADHVSYRFTRNKDDSYAIEWFAGLPYGVERGTIPEAIRAVIAERKQQEAEYEDD